MRLKRRLEDDGGLVLTPLIDMVFLVVIFFMLNTTLSINPAITVELPEAYTSQAVLQEEIVVTLTESAEIYIGKQTVLRDRFAAELKKEMVRLQRTDVILQADALLPYRDVIEIIDLARLTGVETISLVTAQKSLPE
ncbi:MAG: biopolymer transporter ExbD [Spirochaetales bacterium]|jgi:biopolymer transport protein ExbD|nr:biopolymer transporter ExbD [Spirochaetales bacterium]